MTSKRFPYKKQRRIATLLLGILILCFCFPNPLVTMELDESGSAPPTPYLFDNKLVSSASDSGNNLDSVATYSREMLGLDISIMNSFANTSSHQKSLDFSGYHIAGWSLYEVLVSTSNIAAISEREVVGSNDTPSYLGFRIYEHDDIAHDYYNQLAQGFYNMNHNGKLQNISLLYASPSYDPSNQNYAYFDIRSDYQDGSTNMVSSVQLDNVGLTSTWANVTESVMLDADTQYYAVMNGSTLVAYEGFYPNIRWYYQDTAGSFLTRRHNTDGNTWGSDRPFEALLNYTYTPWNTTSNSALDFQDPQAIALQGNSSSLGGSEWLFSSATNVSEVQFSSNQSISIDYNLTLRYKKDITSTSSWYAGTSGTDIIWNITSIIDFPELSGSQDKNLTLALPTDWTANHLFNETSPTEYYDHFIQEGSGVECYSLADETWILECTSPNYLQSLSKYDSSNNNIITDKVSVSVTMDINATIESPAAIPATNGDASLRVFYQSTVEYAENISVTAGTSHHQWDISTDSSSNGLHSIDLYWMNGTEAGYLTSDVLVYYQTNLDADDYFIDAFTENTFYIGVDFNQIFPATGIDSSEADVTYSFGAVVNQSLTDQSNGRWDATVSTASIAPGTHNLYVYAEGYAIENKSLIIEITLIHETEALDISWSNGKNITYIEYTILTVNYTMSSGSSVTGAWVNITISGSTLTLHENGTDGSYYLRFNGSDPSLGFGDHNFTISAWKYGYDSKAGASDNLTLREVPTLFDATWDGLNSITFVESTILSINYTMIDGTPVTSATIWVTIDATPWLLTWDGVTETYRKQFNGDDNPPGLGIHNLTVNASKLGHQNHTTTSLSLTIEIEPTSLVIDLTPFSINYTDYTTLYVDYLMNNSAPISDGTVTITIGGSPRAVIWNGARYELVIYGNDTSLVFGLNSITIQASNFGYAIASNTDYNITLSLEPTNMSVSWSNGYVLDFFGYSFLIVEYTYKSGTPVLNAIINVTIGDDRWDLQWNDTAHYYQQKFNGSDTIPGVGTHSLLIRAGIYGYFQQVNSSLDLTLPVIPTALLVAWTNSDNITYTESSTIRVTYEMFNGTPIDDAWVNITIGTTTWNLTWSPSFQVYEYTFSGSDIDPGLGTHQITTWASRVEFETQTSSNQNITLREEPTNIVISWSNENNPDFFAYSFLIVEYTYGGGSPVLEATINVTIGTDIWDLDWNMTAGYYQIRFNGSDTVPGVGSHNLTILAGKFGYIGQYDDTMDLILPDIPTNLFIQWTNGYVITYSESTTLLVNFTMYNGTQIPDGVLNVSIISDTWDLLWDSDLELYKVIFTELGAWPGLGVHGLEIRCERFGYVSIVNTSQSLTILGENGVIDSYWIGDGSITFIESDTLVVNYTIADGTAISGATVNVTIGIDIWDLVWDAVSETYRLVFNGTDSPPGLGTHGLQIRAWREGYDGLPDNSLTLTIDEDPTTLVISWSNTDSITYFDYTFLFVTYTMSNTSMILDASVNVTIGGISHNLIWNNTQGAYGILLNGSDNPPGFDSHSLVINATKFGFLYSEDLTETLTLSKDPTTIEVMWPDGSSITYVESTTLRVYYRMSNGTPIATGVLNVTIDGDDWELVWNATTLAYHRTFNSSMIPPGLGTFTLTIEAYGDIFASQSTSTSLIITEEPTSAIASWLTYTIDWTQSKILGIDYWDSSGLLIADATQKIITIDGLDYLLQGTNGTYWIEFNNTFDLGHHIVAVNISRFGYEYAVNSTISFDIVEANTDLVLVWNFTTIDYLGQITLSANYTYSGNGETIPFGLVEANITIDGITTLNLNSSGDLWTGTLDGYYLDLGSHSVVIRCQAYGYIYAESSETLTVTEVSTISSVISWTPSNLTIEYTENLTLIVDYTYSGEDVPASAAVNVTIEGRLYNLTYSAGAWRVSIPGSDLGIGIFDADIYAWLYGYELRTNVTTGINVTLAANSFVVTWEPWDLTPTYIDQVNLTVVYTEDFSPILDATVKLYINGSDYDLVYSAVDEMWHFSIDAAMIDLGVWNVTVTANKTGYADGISTDILTVIETPTIFSLQNSGTTFYYDEITTIDVYYQLVNLSSVPGAGISFTLESIEQTTVWNADHWSAVLNGTVLGIGVHTFSISVTAYGFETQSDTLEITVLQIPTSIITDADFTMYARESVSFRFTYIDDRTSTPVYATEFEYDWSEFYTVNMLPNYTYVVTIGGSDFHVGNYTFQLTMGILGFENSTDSVDIVVMPIPTEFVYYTTFSQYENETVLIEVQLFDSAHSTPIDWANVTIELEGVGYIAIYDGSNYIYSVSFRLPARITPGNYNLWLYGDAEDCIFAMELAEVEILAKSTYLLSLTVAEQIQAGSNINVSITLTEDDQPVAGIYVTITIVVHFSEGGQQIIVEGVTTDVNGFVLVTLEVPDNATELEISASFQGSISEWPTETSVVLVDVTPTGTGTGAPIIADPLILGIVTGGISLPILALVFRRRRRGGGGVTSAVSVAPSPSIPQLPTSASGMLQNVIDEIRNSEDGITRAELSRRLGPSASKIGAMVKDLLGTELGFYEVRDGAKKLIKFKK